MNNDPLQILRQVERPVVPRADFADPLLHTLLERLAPEPPIVTTPPGGRRWGRSARALFVAARVRPWRTTAALAGALLLLFLLNLGVAYFAPTYQMALANAPILGHIADPILRFSGLNPAQVTALDESATSSGHTIRLIGGYGDSDRTVLVVEVDGQHPVPNKKQTCCEVQAALQDQFGRSYSQQHALDALTLTFDPLAPPASQVGARLTLHVSALQPLQQPGNMNPEAIPGDWTFHVTLIQNATTVLGVPSGGTANGVTYKFTSARLSGLKLTVSFTVTGTPVDRLRDAAYATPLTESPAPGVSPPGLDFGQMYIVPRLVDTAGNTAQDDEWGFTIPRPGPKAGPAEAQASFVAELPEPAIYTLALGEAPGAFSVAIDAR